MAILLPAFASIISSIAFALPGISSGIHTNLGLFSRWGLRIHFQINMNDVDTYALAQEKLKLDAFLQELTIRSEPYVSLILNIGPAYTIKILPESDLNIFLLGGAGWGRSPYQLHKTKYFLVGPGYYEITPAKDYSLALQSGFDVDYLFHKNLAAVLSGDMVYTVYAFGFTTYTGARTERKEVFLINISAGLRIYL